MHLITRLEMDTMLSASSTQKQKWTSFKTKQLLKKYLPKDSPPIQDISCQPEEEYGNIRRPSFVRQIFSSIPMRKANRPLSQRYLYHSDEDFTSDTSDRENIDLQLNSHSKILPKETPLAQIRSTLRKLATPIQLRKLRKGHDEFSDSDSDEYPQQIREEILQNLNQNTRDCLNTPLNQKCSIFTIDLPYPTDTGRNHSSYLHVDPHLQTCSNHSDITIAGESSSVYQYETYCNNLTDSLRDVKTAPSTPLFRSISKEHMLIMNPITLPSIVDRSREELFGFKRVILKRDLQANEKFGMKLEQTPFKRTYISTVLEGSLADKASLQVGDQLLEVNGIPVEGSELETIFALIRNSGSVLHIFYQSRNFAQYFHTAVLRKEHGKLGIRLKTFCNGLWIDMVLPNSPASRAGLRKDQRIVGLNCQSVIAWGEHEALHWLRAYPDTRDLTIIVQDTCNSKVFQQPLDNVKCATSPIEIRIHL